MDQEEGHNVDSSRKKRKAGEAGVDSNEQKDASSFTKQPPDSSNNEKSSELKEVEEQKTAEAEQKVVVPITQDGVRPQKKFYRQRAHCNPLSHNDSFEYPLRPDLMDWTTDAFYPGLLKKKDSSNALGNHRSSSSSNSSPHQVRKFAQPTVLDIGCGFGGLTMALARLLPQEIVLGMEIRAKVTEYVRLRIVAARKDPATALLEDDGSTPPSKTTSTAETTAATSSYTTTTTAATITQETERGEVGPYQNAAVLRTNSMKFLPHYFCKHSLHKLFFCFPDPHFKRKNHPRRIISDRLLTEYAYLLQPNVGKLYCITDVCELHEWHVAKCNAHPYFELVVHFHPKDAAVSSSKKVIEKQERDDPCIRAMMHETEEGKKVARNGGDKFYAVYRRVERPSTIVNAHNFFT